MMGFIEESMKKYSFCLRLVRNKQGGANGAAQPIHGASERQKQKMRDRLDPEHISRGPHVCVVCIPPF